MKKRLTVENRLMIDQLLRLNYKLKDISNIIEFDKSTVSREIKNRRITGNGTFKECTKLNRYPFVCNGCIEKVHCRKKKYYYNYVKAQNNYNYLLKHSRIGIDMNIDEIEYWNDYFKDKIKNKNQPIILKKNFLRVSKHFIIIFIKVILLISMMKCSQELTAISQEKELMRNLRLGLIT